MSSFSIDESEYSGNPVLVFEGYCAEDGSLILSDRIRKILAGKKNIIIVDMTRCSVISSPGIPPLLDIAMEIVEDNKGCLVFTGLNKTKEDILRMTGVIPIAHVSKTIEDAGKLIEILGIRKKLSRI